MTCRYVIFILQAYYTIQRYLNSVNWYLEYCDGWYCYHFVIKQNCARFKFWLRTFAKSWRGSARKFQYFILAFKYLKFCQDASNFTNFLPHCSTSPTPADVDVQSVPSATKYNFSGKLVIKYLRLPSVVYRVSTRS